jgi:ER lumen protein retaining receptor
MKTQELYALVFLCRYLDVFWNDLSWYLTIMKVIFISSTVYTIYLMRYRYRKSYNVSEDTFPYPRIYLIVPCALLSLVWHKDWTPFEVRRLPKI